MKGLCATSANPDMWFPEFPPRGGKSATIKRALAVSIVDAVESCSMCPIKSTCLEYGMEEENLPYGIWGGKLAGERLRNAGYTLSDTDDLNSPIPKALKFEEVMKPYIEARLRGDDEAFNNHSDIVDGRLARFRDERGRFTTTSPQ